MKVLFEDSHILVCEKPAGVATQSAKVTEKDMVSEVNNYLRRADAKASAYLIHRLDKPVRGVLLFAKNKNAAQVLNRQLQDGNFNKLYHAIVEGKMSSDEGVLENYIYKDSKLSKAVIADSKNAHPDVKKAVLEYRVITEYEVGTVSESETCQISDNESEKVCDNKAGNICQNSQLLEIHLITGRFHQIRCQLSNIGHPIVGDSLYGSTMKYPKRNAIALTAYSLSFTHPKTGKEMKFEIN